MIFSNLPQGTAEFAILVLVALFLAYLWFQDKFNKNKANGEWDESHCALAKERAAAMCEKIDGMEGRYHDLATQLLEQNKTFLNVIESNTRAITLLAERLK